jgi:hypothetical protein
MAAIQARKPQNTTSKTSINSQLKQATEINKRSR